MNLIKVNHQGKIVYLNPNSIITITPTEPDGWGSTLIIKTVDGVNYRYSSSKQSFAATALIYLQQGNYDLTNIQ